jgi:hypothetical protein
VLASGLLFLVSNFSRSLSCDWGSRGDAKLDTTALDELIAQVRGTVTAVAEAESKLTAVRAELSDQGYKARLDARSALLKDVAPLPKAASSGWLPSNG